MTDSKYFKDTKKGSEIHDWKQELNSAREDKKKEAVKKVIAAMTIGKDVSMLFTDVLNCMQTNNIELKKLVYLYVMNYAKSQPEKAILAVNTFQKDSGDPNPLIRALAIRTMGCIRLEKISEYLCEPLKARLKDDDPYVRKTAAVCVAKLYDISPELVEERGFLDMLNDLLSDSNPMVVANAVAALSEIDEVSETSVFEINTHNLNKLLLALEVCTEWGQVFILTSLAKYTPRDTREAESISERVTPRLNHANSAVVLSTVKVLMVYMDMITSPDFIKNLCTKMGPHLVTLLSKEPEIQYVALRNINLIIQKRTSILQYEMKIFFCKYNDPIYVKMEKLEIMIILASERNIDQVLSEFKEYATEIDIDFVRKSVRAIGRCAIKLEKAAEKCIQVLLELIQTKVNYVVQEAIIVIKDIFRKYPNRYESIIATLCENLDTLDEPEAKASMIWIIGEYAERIENADELLDAFLENFADENTQVQLQLLTATVKLFLKRPNNTQEMVQTVLNMATQESDNPDLRDRGFIYWRLLSTDPEAAKAVVLSEKPLISDNISSLEPSLLDTLIHHISSLASVYHKPPESFVSKMKPLGPVPGAKQEKPKKEKKEKRKKKEKKAASAEESSDAPVPAAAPEPNLLDLDLTQSGNLGGQAQTSTQAVTSGVSDLNFFDAPVAGSVAPAVLPPVLTADKGAGMAIAAAFIRQDGSTVLSFSITNSTQAPLSGFAFQFNTNSFNLVPAAQPQIQQILPGQTQAGSIPINNNGPASNNPLSDIVQIAVKNNIQISYFQMNVSMDACLEESGNVDRQEYLQLWRSIPDSNESSSQYSLQQPPAAFSAKLLAHNFFEIARRTVDNNEIIYYSAKHKSTVFLIEISFIGNSIKVAIKTSAMEFIPLMQKCISNLVQ